MIAITKPSFIEEYAKTSGIVIKLTDEKVQKADQWATEVIKAKKTEGHHKTDSRSTHKRFLTGMLGELALEEVLQIPTVNWAIGKSTAFKSPDLKHAGFDVGIKTVNYGMFPLVSKNPTSSEIINIKISDNEICVVGLVTLEDIKNYTNDDLLFDKNAKKRKTGFWNLSAAKPFKSLDELKSLVFPDYWPIDWS